MSASARIQDFEYLYASNTNVSNFVSVKLSGSSNYHLWKEQMFCLLDSNNMCGIVDATFVGPRYSGTETARQYNSLARGWILGSISEDVLVDVYNLGSAKAVWEKLKFICDPAMRLREDSTSHNSDAKTENEDMVTGKTDTIEEGANSIEVIVGKDMVMREAQTKNEVTQKSENKIEHKKSLLAATIKGDWLEVESILKKDEGLVTEAIRGDGSTILHIAVEIGHNSVVKKLIPYINDEQVLKQRSDGSTALHIAAIIGNKGAANLLVKKNSKLLLIKDGNGEEPLQKACENMHLDTIGYLLKAVNEDAKTELQSSLAGSDDDIGVHLLVNAISAKQYSLASELLMRFPKSASKRDDVLMAIAKTYPSELDYAEKLIYPSPFRSAFAFLVILGSFIDLQSDIANFIHGFFRVRGVIAMRIISVLIFFMFCAVPVMLALPFLTAYLSIVFLYFLCWKGAKMLDFGPVKHIENKKKEWDEAKKLLESVCYHIGQTDYSGSHHPHYTRPILEAACQNAFKVVDDILFRSPEVIHSRDKNGHDIFQLAIIHRSEKIYNLIYDIGEHKNLYRSIVDSSKNNILHLVGRLAPSSVLNQRTGAASQLQRELQWREEVKKLVYPTYITQENIFKETPDMVFTTEHEKLVKEGEQWMKTTAESCSITAALITTIVFAAAITVPGGNQENGTPLLKNKSAFIIFAISDAISLFASTTALLVFLSILTARFAEKDFLVSLPRRLFIGLFTLILSTTTMMIAFSATLFLVFCDGKVWMLALICGLAFIPIAFFVGLQFPLMVDLFRSTYIPIFGKQKETLLRRFKPDDIRLRFGK